ncbi:transketolase, partial [Streptomyces sp. NPDC059909]
RSFGWTVLEADGHEPDQLRTALSRIPYTPGRPTVLLARTVKGKGLPYVEGQARSHYVRLTERGHRRARAAVTRGERTETTCPS